MRTKQAFGTYILMTGVLLLFVGSPGWCVDWEPVMGCLPTWEKEITVEIISPDDGAKFDLGTDPIQVAVEHGVKVTADETDITDQVSLVEWTAIHSWKSETKSFSSETNFEGTPQTLYYTWGAFPEGTGPREGKVKIYVKVTYRGKLYYPSPDHITILIGGTDPSDNQICGELTTDRTRAIGWAESSFTQFRATGLPYWTENAWGIMQLHEPSWADTFNWVDVAWRWNKNAENGLWVFNWLATRLTEEQQGWTDAQKLDARTYGYLMGDGNMRAASWNTIDGHYYVNTVRDLEDEKPWEG